MSDLFPEATGRALVTVDHRNNEPSPDEPAGEFDWFSDDSVIVPPQPAIAVYSNARGDIVIRQERDWCDDEDAFIYVSPENLETLMRALDRFAAAHEAGGRGR